MGTGGQRSRHAYLRRPTFEQHQPADRERDERQQGRGAELGQAYIIAGQPPALHNRGAMWYDRAEAPWGATSNRENGRVVTPVYLNRGVLGYSVVKEVRYPPRNSRHLPQ